MLLHPVLFCSIETSTLFWPFWPTILCGGRSVTSTESLTIIMLTFLLLLFIFMFMERNESQYCWLKFLQMKRSLMIWDYFVKTKTAAWKKMKTSQLEFYHDFTLNKSLGETWTLAGWVLTDIDPGPTTCTLVGSGKKEVTYSLQNKMRILQQKNLLYYF